MKFGALSLSAFAGGINLATTFTSNLPTANGLEDFLRGSGQGRRAQEENNNIEQAHFYTGYGPAEWDYTDIPDPAPTRGLYGWSYYIRAFNLIADQPIKEIGWGQWSKPDAPTNEDGTTALTVCGINPHGLTCEDDRSLDSPPWQLAASEKNCGYIDYHRREQCKSWVCGEEDLGGVRGSIEGGMGYWMYTLETPWVKWMLPGATNANYEIFGGTNLADRPQPCTTMGGAVRISNRLLIPNNFVSFEGEDTTGKLFRYSKKRVETEPKAVT